MTPLKHHFFAILRIISNFVLFKAKVYGNVCILGSISATKWRKEKTIGQIALKVTKILSYNVSEIDSRQLYKSGNAFGIDLLQLVNVRLNVIIIIFNKCTVAVNLKHLENFQSLKYFFVNLIPFSNIQTFCFKLHLYQSPSFCNDCFYFCNQC